MLAYSIYILISCISILVASNKIEALIVFFQYITFFSTFVFLFYIYKSENINFFKFFVSLTFFSVLIESYGVLSSVYEYFILNGNAFQRDNILRGFSGNINMVSFSLAIKLPIVIYLFFKIKNKLYQALIFLSLVSLSLVIFILLSRGAFIGYILVLFMILCYKMYESPTVNFKKTIAVILTVIIAFISTNRLIDKSNSDVILERVVSITDSKDASIDSRLRYYNAALSSISLNPIIGVGIGNWKFISIKLDYKDMRDYIIPLYAHNDLLHIAAEIGIIGALAYLMIFIFAFRYLVINIIDRKNIFESISLLGVLAVYFLDSMLNFPVSRPISHVFIIFALIAITNINESTQDD